MQLLEQLDEPQKPVVPGFVAEYLNYCMANEWTLGEVLTTGKSRLPEYLHKAVDWLNDSMNQNIFAQAWLYGYEVEKEPLYTVTINLDRKYYLAVDEGDGNEEIITTLTTTDTVFGYRYFLTEQEIKSSDENLWNIAVPVEKGYCRNF